MGAYIETSDLINGLSEREMAELTGDLTEEQAITSIQEWAIDSAESLIDTYIATQVAVPVVSPSPLIKNMAMNLAKYYLFLRRHKLYEAISDEYAHIVKMLEKIASGDIPIDLTISTRDTVDYGSDDRLFNSQVGI